MFSKILIANRGEIACRIARTAHQMGIQSIAVYSDADSKALHVRNCDKAVALGGNTAAESYLDIGKIISAAKRSGAEAIHPGYGFLSENANFAKQCEAEDLVFIGPNADSIRVMGSKNSARQIVEKAGVPVVPGYDGDEQDVESLKAHADKTGYPILIKAVSGGGGKGMRIVESAEGFSDSLNAVKRESLAAFADDRVLLEKYIPVARHIEVQIFSDSHGNTVHLFERDCSMQRRHQKVIEESPAPLISSRTREKMTAAAIACARSVDYRGAGTVEFLYCPDKSFYFIEMNTRLQVEHPVTEMVTGQDLVEWQLRVAAGEPLPCSQAQIQLRGHAIETRIYAENPMQQFLPSTGKIAYLHQPDTAANVRVDTGVQINDIISPYYDPMISKLIVWAENREESFTLLARQLEQTVVLGVQTNISFLHNLVSHERVRAGKLETRFIDSNVDALIDETNIHAVTSRPESVSRVLSAPILATAYKYLRTSRQQRQSNIKKENEYSPWMRDGFQLLGSEVMNHFFPRSLNDSSRDSSTVEQKVTFSFVNGIFHFPESDQSFHGKLIDDHHFEIRINHQLFTATADATSTGSVFMHFDGRHHVVEFDDPMDINATSNQGCGQSSGTVISPMPGTVIDVLVRHKQTVKAGDPLMILEAMKMEHQISANIDGKVRNVYFQKGDQVQDGTLLLEIEAIQAKSKKIE